MKRLYRSKNLLAAFIALGLITGCVLPAAAERGLSADFTVAALSQYIWRGQELSRDSVVIQPSATVSHSGFAANLWGNLDTAPYAEMPGDDGPQWNETDFTLSYGKRFGPWSIEGGYIYYGLEVLEDSQELFLSAGFDTLLAPTISIYRDFDSYEHWYFLLGLSYALQITEAVSLTFSASASYLKSEDAEAYPEFDDHGVPTDNEFSDFHDGVVSASLPISVSKDVTVTPSISYAFPLSGSAGDDMEARSLEGDDSFIYGGITLSVAF